MVNHEKLEIEGYFIPMHYVALSEIAGWKEIKYRPKKRHDQDPSTLPTEIWPMTMTSWRWKRGEGTTWGVVPHDGDSELSVLITTEKGDGTNSFRLWLEHDIRSEAFTREARWLLPIYSVTEWQEVGVFDMKRYRSPNELVLERINGRGAMFRRFGTFKLQAELNGNGPWRFWNSALRFDALEGVEPGRFVKML